MPAIRTLSSTSQLLAHSIECIRYPSYRPDLAPNVKNKLHKQRFSLTKETNDTFKNNILEVWIERMQKCINRKEEYLKK